MDTTSATSAALLCAEIPPAIWILVREITRAHDRAQMANGSRDKPYTVSRSHCPFISRKLKRT